MNKRVCGSGPEQREGEFSPYGFPFSPCVTDNEARQLERGKVLSSG